MCHPFVDGILVRMDQLHFTPPFAEWLAPHLERRLEQVGVHLG
jgi:hypothetical protein